MRGLGDCVRGLIEVVGLATGVNSTNPSDRHCHAIAGMKSIMARSLSSDRLIIDERAVGFGANPAVHYSTLLVQTMTTGELGWDLQDQHRAR